MGQFERELLVPEEAVEAVGEHVGPGVQPLLETGALLLEVGEHSPRRGHRERVLHIRTAEEGGLVRGSAVVPVLPETAVDAVEDVGSARDRADREAAAECLAVGGQVGDDAEVVLGAAWVRTQTGQHLVEEEHDAAAGSQVAQRPQEVGRAECGVAALDGLDEDGRHGVTERVDGVEGVLAAVLQHDQLGDGARGDAARDGHGARAAGAAEHGVDVPVVRAAEHDDLVAPGRGTGQPDRRRVRLRTGTRERHPLHTRHLGQQCGHFTGVGGAGTEPEPLREMALYGIGDELRLVPEEQGAEAHGDVGVVVAVDIGEP